MLFIIKIKYDNRYNKNLFLGYDSYDSKGNFREIYMIKEIKLLIICIFIGIVIGFICFLVIDITKEQNTLEGILSNDDIYGYEWGMITDDGRIIKKFIK